MSEKIEMWEHVEEHNRALDRGIHYSVIKPKKGSVGMDALRTMFSEGEANDMNFVLFSTSGVHGTYTTIEEAEEGECPDVTFLIVHPRLVSLRYGECRPKSEDDFKSLKKLRESSKKIVGTIG